jgi:hypothetical protein
MSMSFLLVCWLADFLCVEQGGRVCKACIGKVDCFALCIIQCANNAPNGPINPRWSDHGIDIEQDGRLIQNDLAALAPPPPYQPPRFLRLISNRRHNVVLREVCIVLSWSSLALPRIPVRPVRQRQQLRFKNLALNHFYHSHPYQQYLDSPATQGLCRKQQE